MTNGEIQIHTRTPSSRLYRAQKARKDINYTRRSYGHYILINASDSRARALHNSFLRSARFAAYHSRFCSVDQNQNTP